MAVLEERGKVFTGQTFCVPFCSLFHPELLNHPCISFIPFYMCTPILWSDNWLGTV